MSAQNSMDHVFISKLNTIIENHLEDDQFGVEELANASGVSRSQLHRKLNAINGKSTSQFIREFRLERAMAMLRENLATASEIAYKVGFSSPTYFNTRFHEYFGFPPGEVKFRYFLKDSDRKEIVLPKTPSQSKITTINNFRKRTYLIASLAVILVLSFAYYKFKNPESHNSLPIKNPVILSDNSIAVLPFKNMSGNPDNEAFCDGMTTAIISRLSKIKDMKKVISQTSVMSYKNSQKKISLIAKELKVHYILETGFQKSGSDIKINIQLIDGISDKLLWSEEYEAKYDFIFEVQAHVAEVVAKKLKAKITEEEHVGIYKPSTKNMEAYENELQGFYLLTSNSIKNIIASRKYFEKAIELDSSYADAYASLGRSYSTLGTWSGNISRREADSLAAPYFKKALQLNPENIQSIYSMSEKELFNWNFKAADSLINIFEQHRGKFFYSTFIDLLLYRNDQVIESTHYLLTDDPDVSWGYNAVLAAYAYYSKDDITSSLYVMKKALPLGPNSDYYDHFGNIYLAMGNYQKAKEVLETGLQISDKRHASMVIHLAAVYHFLGNGGKSKELLNEVIDRANKGEPEINVFVAHYYARVGNFNKAFNWLNTAYTKHEVDLIWLKADPNLVLLKKDLRYTALCKKIGFPENK